MDREVISDTSPISFFRRPRNGINVDISFRCPLECLRCQRQTYYENNKAIPGGDLTLSDFEKITHQIQMIVVV